MYIRLYIEEYKKKMKIHRRSIRSDDVPQILLAESEVSGCEIENARATDTLRRLRQKH